MRRSLRLWKKRKTNVIPLDLQIEILNRLPAKSVLRFMVVSKSWEQIIRSKSFITSFPFRSLTQPCRLLVALINIDAETGNQSCYFFSSSSLSSSTSFLSTSFLSRVTLTSLKNEDYRSDHSYYVNGLMIIGRTICNPTTGKLITLPRLFKTSRRKRVAKRFFGYDPIDNQYKVLSMARLSISSDQGLQVLWSDFRVFTLGTKPESWRTIECSVPHTPWSNGLCIDGAVYYIAYTVTRMQLSLMRFDLKSEKLDVFARVSEDVSVLCIRQPLTLINYHGKVATAIKPFLFEPSFDLFVFEAGKQDFNKEMSFHNIPRGWRGIINHTGEITFIFASSSSKSKEDNFILYDLKDSSYKNMKIEVDANHDRYSYKNYLVGYVESLMLL